MRTPLGLGLTVDKQNMVAAIAPGSQAERSGCFDVDDQVISLNGKLLSDKYSAYFEQMLSTFPMGSKVALQTAMGLGLGLGSNPITLTLTLTLTRRAAS